MNDQPELDLAPEPILQPSDDLPRDFVVVLGFLHMRCRGPENAATAEQLAGWAGIFPQGARKVRNLLSIYTDRMPFVVCGMPGCGYYVTADIEAMRQYDRLLFSLLKASAARLSGFRRLARRLGYEVHGSAERVFYTKPERRDHAA
jgi:hypothetical protein